MSIPWGVVACLALGLGALWLIADAKESVGRLKSDKRKAASDMKAIEDANEAENDVADLDATERRRRLRNFSR